jgi:ribonuclease PH
MGVFVYVLMCSITCAAGSGRVAFLAGGYVALASSHPPAGVAVRNYKMLVLGGSFRCLPATACNSRLLATQRVFLDLDEGDLDEEHVTVWLYMRARSRRFISSQQWPYAAAFYSA